MRARKLVAPCSLGFVGTSRSEASLTTVELDDYVSGTDLTAISSCVAIQMWQSSVFLIVARTTGVRDGIGISWAAFVTTSRVAAGCAQVQQRHYRAPEIRERDLSTDNCEERIERLLPNELKT